jgi:hypothetical protein
MVWGRVEDETRDSVRASAEHLPKSPARKTMLVGFLTQKKIIQHGFLK